MDNAQLHLDDPAPEIFPDAVSATETESFVQRIIANPILAAAMYYASCLAANVKALAFIADELHMTPEEATAQSVGFSDRTLGKHLPNKRLKSGREIRETLQAINLFKANGRETLRGYVTIPIRDEAGTIIGIRGHKTDKHAGGPETIVVGNEGVQRATVAQGHREEVENLPANQAKSANEDVVSTLIMEDSSLIFTRGDRRYRIRGLEKNNSVMVLKVNLMVSRDKLVHLDTIDLLKARSRASFIKAASSELFIDGDVIKKDIGNLLLELETLQTERIAALKNPTRVEVKMTDDERAAALSLLRDPNFLERIVADIDACGMVGESTNKLAGYLAATSRKLDQPLAIVIQSSSSAGKTSLMDAILDMMPPEDVQRFSGMTGQSLFYLDSDQIKHKILAISEDEGIRQATYALKLLQSEGELRHATVGRGESGKPQTQEHHVQGPVQIFLTTTAMDMDEELVNRCLVLSVDETHGQTDAIQLKQRHACTADVKQSHHVAASLRGRRKGVGHRIG